MPGTMLGAWSTMQTKQKETDPDFMEFSTKIKLRPKYIITSCDKCFKGKKKIKKTQCYKRIIRGV